MGRGFDLKLIIAVLFIGAAILAALYFSGVLAGLSPSNVVLEAEFQPGTIKSGESAFLAIRVENQKDERYSPIVRIRPEKMQDEQYLSFGQVEWALYPMENTGEVQIKRINVSATSPASESRFNAIVSLEEGNDTVFTKKVPLIVQREE